MKDLFARLPEKTPGDQALKVHYALRGKNNDEAIRLLTMLNKTDPGDINIAVQLSTMLKTADQLPQGFCRCG